MKKIKIFVDRELPSPAEINGYMNFDNVLKQYNRATLPVYKRSWFKWGMATVVVAGATVALLVSVAGNSTNNNVVQHKQPLAPAIPADETPCIHPPIEGAEPAGISFFLSSQRDTVIVTSNGSRIFVPAAIAGIGAYELRIREFQKMPEIFLSGIPMDYDSAGRKYAFQSAGMIEILAFRNGKQVEMEKGKSVKVELHGNYPGTDMNVYCLDTAAKKWLYKGKDKVQAEKLTHPANLANTTEETENRNAEQRYHDSILSLQVKTCTEEYNRIVYNTPVEPQKADTAAYYFDLKFSEKKFPEMKAFRNAHFQVLPESKFFNSSFYSTKWQSISVKEIERARKYIFHVERKNNNSVEKFDIAVKPVFEEKAYDSAYKAFGYAMNEHQKALKSAEEKKAMAELKLKEYEKQLEKREQERQERQQQSDRARLNNRTNPSGVAFTNINNYAVKRYFEIQRFGVWNCDKPWPYENQNPVTILAHDATGQLVKEGKLYICDLNKKAIFTYTEKERDKVRIDAGKFAVWIMDTNEMMHYKNVKVDETMLQSGRIKLEMNSISQLPESPQEVKKLLGI